MTVPWTFQVLLTMGSKIYHFEEDIKPDGTIHIDWKIAPDKDFMNDLSDDTRIKSHAVLRIYSEHTIVKPEQQKPATQTLNQGYYDTPDSKFCYLLGCEAIDIAALMQHSIDVNSGKVDHLRQREYDFPVQTNFCNTFCVCTVVPFETKPTFAEMQQMQLDLNIFRGGLAAYEKEEADAKLKNREPVHTDHAFMPSVLR